MNTKTIYHLKLIQILYSIISKISVQSDRLRILKTNEGKIYAIAQWYPRICVFDDIQGWNTLPYLGASEFYLEYGNFDVSITAPASHVVVASGDLLNPSEVMTAEQLKRYQKAHKSDETVMKVDPVESLIFEL